MRNNIVHPGADELTYEIRDIVEVAKRLEELDTPPGGGVSWENIGDPVAKGEEIPDWIKEKVQHAVIDDATYSYSPTKGLLETRRYIANERNIEHGIQITPEDILFYNGLGDAINALYANLHPGVRIIGPNPAYPTHSSAEGAHAGSRHITYRLDPHNQWYPDVDDIRSKVTYNPTVGGIIFINPDNPTGMVYSQDVMREIVAIAREYDLFIISDEIYSNIWYGGVEHHKLASVVGDVPAIAMRGISKEFPWPGGRCGWVEFYNREKNAVFDRYCQALIDAKMLEVCSTTLPQKLIPDVMSDKRYFPYLSQRCAHYEKRSDEVCRKLSDVSGIIVNKAYGAFYLTIVFEEGVLRHDQSLVIGNDQAREIVEPFIGDDVALDKRFVYFLLAATGICVVPLSSGFNSDLYGFRITLLESDDAVFTRIVDTLADSIAQYLSS